MAALKIAPVATRVAGSLAREGAVYEQLKPVWGSVVPKLLAHGVCNKGRSYMLATQMVAGRHFNPATDSHLLPQLQQALQKVHALGVAHADLREENILVEESDAVPRVWVLDFGHAKLNATPAEKAADMHDLSCLLRAYGVSA